MVQVDYAVLADGAQAVQGKHYILGGGWDALYALAYPVIHPHLAIALRLAVPWNDTNQPFTLELDVQNADGQSILPSPPGPLTGTMNVGRPPHLAQGANQHVVLVMDVANLQFERP